MTVKPPPHPVDPAIPAIAPAVPPGAVSSICRDCFHPDRLAPPSGARPRRRCRRCDSPRVVAHPEVASLTLAHLDCDSFYASVEKRDDPDLRDKPVIVGGGRRGVVAAACYVARLHGVRSAMPMFKALRACPDAVVIRPDMTKYAAVSREIRALMQAATPLVEPLSIDEAFLDLAGTEALHRAPAAETLMRLAARIEQEIGVTVSIGLAPNKLLAKIASRLDKPRGFSVLGRGEAADFLARQPVGLLWGVGKGLAATLRADGITTIGQLQGRDPVALERRYGAMGRRLAAFAVGDDPRAVDPGGGSKSLSAETTFTEDLADRDALAAQLWPLCETVSARLKQGALAAGTAVLKLRGDDFRLLTRRGPLQPPSALAEALYRAALPLLDRYLADHPGARFRLIGIGTAGLMPQDQVPAPLLVDAGVARRAKVEAAIDAVRAKAGAGAILKGRALAAAAKPRQPP